MKKQGTKSILFNSMSTKGEKYDIIFKEVLDELNAQNKRVINIIKVNDAMLTFLYEEE